ncbi:MAG TPA: DoxX family protein [Thermoanaerobaculia bacterium]|nr:DoxX family protein [Thermoanaerobaculia bacterium]
MYTVIGRFAPQTFAIMRIIIGLLFVFHGSQKILGVPPMEGMGGMALPTIAVVAGWIELIGGLLVTIGLFTGIAAFICSGEMAAAFFMGHFAPAMQKGGPWAWNPIVNKGEPAVLYCFIFLYIAAHGAGVWSIDSAIRGRSATAATTS